MAAAVRQTGCGKRYNVDRNQRQECVVPRSVIALGLDATDPVLLEKWIDAGHLPTLARLQREGAYARLTTFEYCRAEASNTTFLTGCRPETHGYWSPFRYHTGMRCPHHTWREMHQS